MPDVLFLHTLNSWSVWPLQLLWTGNDKLKINKITYVGNICVYCRFAFGGVEIINTCLSTCMHVCKYAGSHAHTHAHTRMGKCIQYTISRGICISLIIGTLIDASHREVVDCFLQLSTSAPQPFLPCTQGTVHQARPGEAVGAPQAGSSPHHPSSGLVGIPKKPRACSTSSCRS